MAKNTGDAGITNRPAPREDAEQRQLPPRGKAKDQSQRRGANRETSRADRARRGR